MEQARTGVEGHRTRAEQKRMGRNGMEHDRTGVEENRTEQARKG